MTGAHAPVRHGAAPATAQPRRTAAMRWLADASAWRPSPGELEWLAGLLPAEDTAAVLAQRQDADRKRTLLGRLMARSCCSRALGIPWAAVCVRRTRGRKPFCANDRTVVDSGAPNFNFNLAHEGDYVALASEPLLLVGVDVAEPPGNRLLKRSGGGAARGGPAGDGGSGGSSTSMSSDQPPGGGTAVARVLCSSCAHLAHGSNGSLHLGASRGWEAPGTSGACGSGRVCVAASSRSVRLGLSGSHASLDASGSSCSSGGNSSSSTAIDPRAGASSVGSGSGAGTASSDGGGGGGGGAAERLIGALSVLRDQLTDAEWARVKAAAPDEAAVSTAFQQAWSAKEAYVKAIGLGLGFAPLSRLGVEVERCCAPGAAMPCCSCRSLPAHGPQHDGSGGCGGGGGSVVDSSSGAGNLEMIPSAARGVGSNSTSGAALLGARLTVDGAPQPGWRVCLRRLPRGHWAAVALGPPAAAVDAFGEFTGTFQCPDPGQPALAAALAAPEPPFELLTVADLLPPDLAERYEAQFG